MNAYKFMAWGFTIGLASVGIPSFLLVVCTDARAERSAWWTILVSTLVGAVWSAALAPRKNRADLRRAAWLGVYAWLPALIVCAMFLGLTYFFYLPFLIAVSLPFLLAGAGIGAAVAGALRLEGLSPPVVVVTRPRRRLTPPRRRFRV
jgi:hypothetical protein